MKFSNFLEPYSKKHSFLMMLSGGLGVLIGLDCKYMSLMSTHAYCLEESKEKPEMHSFSL